MLCSLCPGLSSPCRQQGFYFFLVVEWGWPVLLLQVPADLRRREKQTKVPVPKGRSQPASKGSGAATWSLGTRPRSEPRGAAQLPGQGRGGRGWSHLAGCTAAELSQLLPEAGVGVGDGPDGSDGIQHLLAAQLRDGHDVGDDHGGAAGDAGEAGEEKGCCRWSTLSPRSPLPPPCASAISVSLLQELVLQEP